MMPAIPPRELEALVGWLIPPARREEVLGDLYERYWSPRQYLLDAARTVPLVIASQIRRTTDAQLLLIEGFAAYLPFLTAAWLVSGATFLYEQSGFARVAIPAAAAFAALILGDAYSDPRKAAAYHRVRVAALASVCACLSQMAVWAVNGGFLVPRTILLCGASLSVLLLSALRIWFRREGYEARRVISGGAAAGATAEENNFMSLDDIRKKSEKLQKKAWRDTLGGMLGILAVLGIVFLYWKVVERHTASDRIVDAAIVAAALFIAYRIFRTRPSGGVPPDATLATSVEIYHAQLARRRDTLRGMRLWYAGPVLGILLALALRVPLAHLDQPGLWANVAPFSILAVALAIALMHVSQRRAQEMQREMDALDGAEKGR